jgi:hypothetical protein
VRLLLTPGLFDRFDGPNEVLLSKLTLTSIGWCHSSVDYYQLDLPADHTVGIVGRGF